MEEQKNNKLVLNIELDDEVKRVSITGLGDDNKVVMAHELDEEELKQATGGASTSRPLGQTNWISGIPRNPYCQGDICTEYTKPCHSYKGY